MRSSAVLLCLLWLQAVAGGDDRRSLAEDAAPEVEMVTSLGSMRFMLTPQMTPATVSNFLAYVDDGFFDGLIFHRVIENVTVQGGGFDAAMHQRATRDPIPLEAASAMSNGRGTIAMARANVAASATSQFFVNHKDNANLDASSTSQGYAVFGFLVGRPDDRSDASRGLATLDAVAAVATHAVTVDGHAFQNVPVEPVLITSVRRVGPAPGARRRAGGAALTLAPTALAPTASPSYGPSTTTRASDGTAKRADAPRRRRAPPPCRARVAALTPPPVAAPTLPPVAAPIAAPPRRRATSLGSMAVELTPGLTPLTVANFLAYVDDGFFDGLIFHRVIENFMVQGGGFDDEMNEKPARDPIPLERSGVSNRRGTIAMARTNHPDSAASEFFINHADNKFLDSRSNHNGYCAFGLIAGDDAAAGSAASPAPAARPNARFVARARARADAAALGGDEDGGADDRRREPQRRRHRAAGVSAAFFSLFLVVYCCKWKRELSPTTHDDELPPSRGHTALTTDDDMYLL
ncbi:peptidyl-prolyl cis-trans isomerase [Aureococcus anophagefferens]|nr:peptidyl-prolyl cis-trans isomerase [Aureococcus anophagefferens]